MTRLFDLTGSRALVTGSSRGIGLALARGLAQHGAAVVLNGRDTERLARAADELRSDVPEVEVTTSAFDVTDPSAVESGVAEVTRRDGPIDVLVNNTGIQHREPLLDVSPDIFDHVVRTNLTSAFLVGREVARTMVERGAGSIVNICSIQTTLARPGIAAYASSKGALGMLTRSMCAEWAAHGITVNGLAPGYIETELTSALVEDPEFSDWVRRRTPAGRWGTVQDLVGTCVWLCAPASRFVNGQVVHVDGGMSAVV